MAVCHLVNVFLSLSLAASSVTWRKSDVEIRSDALHVLKAAGERHSLAIKQMRPSDAGSYCVTAVNAAGSASCSATLYIQSGEARQTHWNNRIYSHSFSHNCIMEFCMFAGCTKLLILGFDFIKKKTK